MEKTNNLEKEKANKRAKEYYAKNREKVLKQSKLKSNTTEAKENKRLYDKAYSNANRVKIKSRFDLWYSENKNKVISSAKQWKKGNPLPRQFNSYKERAKKKGLDFLISKEDFIELIQQDCAYCGQEKPLGADRIDSSLGYTYTNVVACCKHCNAMKLDHSLGDFILYLRRIHKYLDL